MPSNYKKLGPYIREVNIRNTDLRVTTLLGVSIQKVLMPSIANTIGTDMSTYKIIKRNQFAYGPVTSRNGDKISIALLQEHDEAIVSQAYVPFEIIDHNEVEPEYLMMWFRRPEFDRYARFKSHGSARETFDWDEMCDTELPIPHIDVQRAMVKEYNTITSRIALNEQLNQKLEETAQTLYRQWFVDFEFPYDFEKGEPSIQGKPYKSNGGEMVWCAELEKEIPKGWELKRIDQVCDVINGRAYLHGEYRDSGTQIIRIQNLRGGTDYLYSDFDLPKKKYAVKGDLLFAWSATYGPFIWRGPKSIYHYHIWKMNCFKKEFKLYLFTYLSRETKSVSEQGSGSLFSHITKTLMDEQKILDPDNQTLKLYDDFARKIDRMIESNIDIISQLKQFENVMSCKMSTVEVGVGGGVGVG